MSNAILGAIVIFVVLFVFNTLWGAFGPLPGRPDDKK